MKIDLSKLKTSGERLKYIRTDLLKMSRSDIYKKYGLSQDTLAAWENEKIKISEKGIDRCIKIYNSEKLIVSREWVLIGEGLPPNFSFDLNRYFNTLQTNETETKIDDNFLLVKEIEFFRSLSPNSITSLVSSEDMLPAFSRGDYVGGRFRYGREISDCIGKNCIIKTKGGSLFIRRLASSPSGKGYNLVCLNPKWDGNPEPVLFNVDVESVAPIIWHRRLDD